MEAILPTKKMVVEAELVSSEVGRGYKKAKEVPEMAGVVTEEVGMALEVLVIRTSKANQTNNRIQTSTMTSKLLNKLCIYVLLSVIPNILKRVFLNRILKKCPSEHNPQKCPSNLMLLVFLNIVPCNVSTKWSLPVVQCTQGLSQRHMSYRSVRDMAVGM